MDVKIKAEPGSEISIKQESVPEMTSAEVDESIQKLCEEAGEKGIANELLEVALPTVSPLARAQAINRLLGKRSLEILKNEQGQLVYRFVKPQTGNTKYKAKSQEEQVVYGIVERAANQGTTAREIQLKSGLQPRKINQILNALKKANAIKSVKGAKGNKMSFLLYHLEPARSLTGGALFDGQDVDNELVQVLNKVSYSFLEKKMQQAKEKSNNLLVQRQAANATTEEMLDYIKALGICKMELTLKDIDDHLKSLTFEGNVRRTIINDNDPDAPRATYRLVRLRVGTDEQNTRGFVSSPCAVCPVFQKCSLNSYDRSPITCQYYQGWLINNSTTSNLTEQVSTVENLVDVVLSLN